MSNKCWDAAAAFHYGARAGADMGTRTDPNLIIGGMSLHPLQIIVLIIHYFTYPFRTRRIFISLYVNRSLFGKKAFPLILCAQKM